MHTCKRTYIHAKKHTYAHLETCKYTDTIHLHMHIQYKHVNTCTYAHKHAKMIFVYPAALKLSSPRKHCVFIFSLFSMLIKLFFSWEPLGDPQNVGDFRFYYHFGDIWSLQYKQKLTQTHTTCCQSHNAH